NAVVGIVKSVASTLVAIGDRLIPGFKALRERFVNAIKGLIDRARQFVNRIADRLKKAVQSVLDTLKRGLTAALGFLKRGLLAAVNAVKNAVKSAIEFAKKAIAVLGTFAVLINDIAANPGQWISNLASAVVDGIKNHLWKALKSAVKGWFDSKVEEVTGLGTFIFNLLKKGGVALAKVGKMVWQGVVAAIPMALVTILVEKLASMIVPAAGAVLAIIQGIQAAWGTIQRVIAAISTFVVFLKAVKGGNAGPKFAA